MAGYQPHLDGLLSMVMLSLMSNRGFKLRFQAGWVRFMKVHTPWGPMDFCALPLGPPYREINKSDM